MKRRNFLELAGAASFLPVFGESLGFNINGKPRYNVLIIQTDEHNFRTLGCYRQVLSEQQALMWGNPVVETPNIDSIADRGLVADSFYCASPLCSPSRATFVSGCYPQHTDVIDNDIPMNDNVETFAQVLSDAGYVTGYAGKWHLDGESRPGWAPARKFGFADNRYMLNRGHWKKLALTDDGPIIAAQDANGNPIYAVDGADEQSYATDWLTDRTLEFIDEHREDAFCFMVSIPDPHDPDTVRAPFDSFYENEPFEPARTSGVNGRKAPAWGKPTLNNKQYKSLDIKKYFGMVKCIDENVGRILHKLEELGLMEQTIIVFTADHGDMLGEHDRVNKTVPYEASAKVPFVIAAPGLIPAGTRTDVALSTIDFKPTLLGLLGVRSVQACDGKDAAKVFTTGERPAGQSNLVFSRAPAIRQNGAAWLMAVDERYKLVACGAGPLWLFDLKTDPDEMVNRSDDPALVAVRQRMASALLEYATLQDEPYLDQSHLKASLESAI